MRDYLDMASPQTRRSISTKTGYTGRTTSHQRGAHRRIPRYSAHAATWLVSLIFKGIPDYRQTRIAMLRANKMDELVGILEGAEQSWGKISPDRQ